MSYILTMLLLRIFNEYKMGVLNEKRCKNPFRESLLGTTI
jgi:hypothetical protein